MEVVLESLHWGAMGACKTVWLVRRAGGGRRCGREAEWECAEAGVLREPEGGNSAEAWARWVELPDNIGG